MRMLAAATVMGDKSFKNMLIGIVSEGHIRGIIEEKNFEKGENGISMFFDFDSIIEGRTIFPDDEEWIKLCDRAEEELQTIVEES